METNRKRTLLKNTLGSNAHWQQSKVITSYVGHAAAVLLAHLIDIREFSNMPYEFYQQDHRLKNDCMFTDNELKYARAMLKEAGLIKVEKKVFNEKLMNAYVICDDIVIAMLEENESIIGKPKFKNNRSSLQLEK